MARIRRDRPREGFAWLPNQLTQSRHISFRAKGFLLFLLSLPDDFSPRICWLTDNFPEGQHAIAQMLKELEKFGLIKREQIRDKAGKIKGWEYIVYDEIQHDLIASDIVEMLKSDTKETLQDCTDIAPDLDSPAMDEPSMEQPEQEAPAMEKPQVATPQLGNQTLNNKYRNNKYKNKAAAIERAEIYPDPEPAAANFLTTADKIISGDLSKSQKQRVWEVVKVYRSKYHAELGGKAADVLYREMHFDLVNPKAWTRCGNNFEMKLNAIKKHMREGKWRTPTGLIQALQQTDNKNVDSDHLYTGEVKALEKDYRQHLLDLNSCLQVHDSPMAQFPDIVRMEEEKAEGIRIKLKNIQKKLERYGVWDVIKSTLPIRGAQEGASSNTDNSITQLNTTINSKPIYRNEKESKQC